MLVETKVAEEETIEEMVQQMERELDEEFAHLLPATAPTVAQPYAVPYQRVPAATETELEEWNGKIKIPNSFVVIEVPEVPPGPPTTNREW